MKFRTIAIAVVVAMSTVLASALPAAAVGPYSAMKACGSLWVGGYVTGKGMVKVSAAGVAQSRYFYPAAGRVDSQSEQHAGTVSVQATISISVWDGYCSYI